MFSECAVAERLVISISRSLVAPPASNIRLTAPDTPTSPLISVSIITVNETEVKVVQNGGRLRVFYGKYLT